jgi:outer membrane lipopolysaccharide assembly protein LptE/RlpB
MDTMGRVKFAFLVGLCLVVAGCGYNFRGKQNNLPSDVRTVAIPVFENHTGELRIERPFTDETIFQFTRSQMLRVVSEGQADAVLKGIIKEVKTEDVALSRGQASTQRRLTITVSAQLMRRSDGKVLWEDRALEKNRTFNVAGTIQATEQNKALAVTELARDLSQTLHDRVFENF